ncbi:MAG: PD40 domain-containing protein, partial [Alistipes sp.]|nr:PD40 domain-containing protein [Alistipes sp.]
MKKIFLAMAILAMGASGCKERPEPLVIDNALTGEEISAGVLTPEVMWKMRRAGSSSLSPDGTTLLYTVTDYSMEENRSLTQIYTQTLADKQTRRLTDNTSTNHSPQWSADGEKIYFLSNRSGSMQVWEMSADGSNATLLTALEGDVEGFGVSPDGNHLWWVQPVHTLDINSKDVHRDMPKSKARIYDDLMVRHWDYWDGGDYRHIFVGDLGKGAIKAGKDIMPEAKWDAPLAPYFDMSEIAWNPQSTKLAYTSKPLTGKEYAVSTDSDICIYDLETGSTINICKISATEGEGVVGYDKYPVW